MSKAISKGADVSELDPRLFVQSVEKAFRVLEAFAAEHRPLSLAEIAKATGMDRSGAQRLCYTLRKLGYLDLDEQVRGHVPGLRLLDRSYDFLRMHPLAQRATTPLMELRRVTQERVDLSLPDDLTIIYAVRLQSKRESVIATLVGRRLGQRWCWRNGGLGAAGGDRVVEAVTIGHGCPSHWQVSPSPDRRRRRD